MTTTYIFTYRTSYNEERTGAFRCASSIDEQHARAHVRASLAIEGHQLLSILPKE
jgi:hypothetical protein